MGWIGRPVASVFFGMGWCGKAVRSRTGSGHTLPTRASSKARLFSICIHLLPLVTFITAKDVGFGFVGTYEGDEAEMTATVNVGKRSLALQLTLRKLADI